MSNFQNEFPGLEDSDFKTLFFDLIRNAQDGIVVINSKGEVIEWNDSLERITGWERYEVLNKKIWDVMAWMFPDFMDKNVQTKLMRKSIEDSFLTNHEYWVDKPQEYPFVNKKGELRINKVKYSFIVTPTKKYIAAYIKDITDEKKNFEQAHQRIEELTLLSESSSVFVGTKDLDDCYEFLSEKILLTSGCDYLALSAPDETLETIKLKKIIGLEKYINPILKITGKDYLNSTYKFSDMTEDDLQLFTNRKMNLLKDPLYILSTRKIPKPIAKMMEQVLHIDNIYYMGISWNGKLYGGIILGYKKGNDIKNTNLLESLINQSAVVIQRIRAERETMELKDFYETIVENVNDGIWVADVHDNITFCNKGMTAIAGLTKEKILNSNLFSDFPAETFFEFLPYYTKAKETKSVRHYDSIRVVTSSEKVSYQSGWLIPIVVDGTYHGMICTAQDITKRILAQNSAIQSEIRFRELFENAPLAYQSMDENGCILDVNDAWLSNMGYNRNEVIGLPLTNFISDNHADFFAENFPIFLETGVLDGVECALIRKDKSSYQAKFFGNVGKDDEGRFKQTHCLLIDITKQKIIEDQILKSNEELEIRVNQRTQQFQKTLSDLMNEIANRKKIEQELLEAKLEISSALETEKELSQLKSRFISLISHEYRTPLSVILSSAEIIESYNSKSDNEFTNKISKHSNRIQNSVRQLTEMMENVLILKSEGEDKIEIRPTNNDIPSIFKDVIHKVQIVNKEQHFIEFDNQAGELIMNTDGSFIRQILMNLLLNATKYSSSNTDIVVSLSDYEKYIQFKVVDYGVGIEPEELPNLFEPFFKGRKDIGIKKGIGLGLAIVKRNVSALNGEISVESIIGKGTTFTVSIPK